MSRRVVVGTGLLALVLLGGAFAVEGSASLGDQQIAVNFLVSLVAVVGLQSYVGNTGVLSFGHLAFMAVGAYASALVTIPPEVRASQLPLLPLLGDVEVGFAASIVVGVLAAVLAASLLGGVFARFSGTAAVIATFGLLEICNVSLTGLKDVTGGAQGLYGVPRSTTVVSAAVVAVVAIMAARALKASRLGLKLNAGRQDDVAASALGINVYVTRWGAWIASAAIMGAAGALQAHTLAIVSPSSFFLVPTFTLLAMLIVGGLGTVSGAVAGAALITAATELLRGLEDGFALGPARVGSVFGLTQIAIGALILIVLITRPQGLLVREFDELRAGRRSVTS